MLESYVVQLPRMTMRRWLLAIAVAAVVAAGIDCTVMGIALAILIRAARRPHPVHRATAVLLALLTVVLLWANLRPTGWQEELGGVDAPVELDPFTKAMFWRGWPLSPCMVCLVHGLRFHPGGIEQWALALDGVVFVAALFIAKALSEHYLR
jgi:hypothetical protein